MTDIQTSNEFVTTGLALESPNLFVAGESVGHAQ